MTLDTLTRVQRLGVKAARLVQDGMTVGLGTGSTAAAMIEALGQRVHEGLSIRAVPTSNETLDQATRLGIPLAKLNDIERLDLCIDGADEIDPDLTVVKGRGGALLFEKLVAQRSDRYVIIATDEKLVEHLGMRMPLPVEIVPEGWVHTAQEIALLGMAPTLRGGDGGPFRTDGGHYIVDCEWPGDTTIDVASLAQALKLLTGVVDHGLFIDMVDMAMTIDAEGRIVEHTRPA
jgi:ribose 5-phosphate isomerase A